MSSYELTFAERPKTDRNLKTGRFIKGMTPHNKGKKWSEWMDGRKQKRVKKQALIDKACEWLEDNAINYVGKDGITAWRSAFADFRKAMKGGENE